MASDLEAIRSELARIRALEEKAPKGPWSHSAQTGPAGHCFVAQVWGHDGCSVAEIQTTADPTEATGVAAFTASARTDVPRLVKALARAVGAIDYALTHDERLALAVALADIARLLKEE